MPRARTLKLYNFAPLPLARDFGVLMLVKHSNGVSVLPFQGLPMHCLDSSDRISACMFVAVLTFIISLPIIP